MTEGEKQGRQLRLQRSREGDRGQGEMEGGRGGPTTPSEGEPRG